MLWSMALAMAPWRPAIEAGRAAMAGVDGTANAADAPGQTASEVAPWPVLRPAASDLPMGEELLLNPGFEAGTEERADGWLNYMDGYAIALSGGRGGSRALRLENEPATAAHGALQVITLNQDSPRPIYFAGWSRADAVTGTVDGNYSVYLDLRYIDGTPLYGQRLDFDAGTHDWQRLEKFIVPEKPVERINVYCLLRNNHGGTAWFDDLTVREVHATLADFDGTAMAVLPRPDDLPAEPTHDLATADGLTLRLGPGGAVGALAVDGTPLSDPGRDYLGGVLVRDVAARGDVVHVGGTIVQDGAFVRQTSSSRRWSSTWRPRWWPPRTASPCGRR